VQQASDNTKEQFSNSPDLASGILYAIMDALTAHSAMCKQALESDEPDGRHRQTPCCASRRTAASQRRRRLAMPSNQST